MKRDNQRKRKKYKKGELLRKIVFESSDGFIAFVLDKNYNYLDFSYLHKQTMKVIWGVDIKIGDNMLDYIGDEEDRLKAKNNFDRVLRGESFILYEEYGDTKLNKRFYENRYSPVLDNGSIIGVFVIVIDITRIKIAEENVKQSNETIDAILKSLPDLMFIIDKNYIFKDYYSPNMKKLFAPPEKFLGRRVDDVLPKPVSKIAIKKIAGVLKSKRTEKFDYSIEFNGKMHYEEIRIVPKSDNEVLAIIRDITKVKETEIKLKENEIMFRTLFDENPAPIVITTLKDRKIISVNKKFLDIFGFAKDEVMGRTPMEINIWTNKKDNEEMIKIISEKGYIDGFEAEFNAKDGHMIVGLMSGKIIDINGVKFFLSVTKDITDLKQTENNLRDSEENLKIILNSIGDAVIAVDREGKITHINPVAEKMTGWEIEQAKGNKLEEVFRIINGDTREEVKAPVDKVLKYGKTIELDRNTVLLSKDGVEYNIADSVSPIRDIKGDIHGIVIIFRDITDKLRREKEQMKLEQLESIGLLAGGIAHDFNNILTGIFGNIEMAKIKIDKKESIVYKYLISAGQALSKATDLTKQLLTFAKGGEPVLEAVDLETLVKSTVSFNLSGSNIKPNFDFEDNLWQVKADKNQISRVITNLIVNAKEAMPDGGNIYIKAFNIENFKNDSDKLLKGSYVKLIIEDEGIGIPQKYIERIFNPYFTTKQNGSGLGLSIVHSIIKKHKGSIEIESVQGKGTKFIILLPAQKSEQTKKEKKDIKISKKVKFTGKVLIMDDEEMIREVAGNMLHELGFDIDFAFDGKEAFEKYKKSLDSKEVYTIVILDLTIKGGPGGKFAAKRILQLNPKAKLIVSSGYSSDPIIANYEAYGFKGRIIKPFNMNQLKNEIIRVLGIK
jgi:PAS domain S-box-containing protein